MEQEYNNRRTIGCQGVRPRHHQQTVQPAGPDTPLQEEQFQTEGGGLQGRQGNSGEAQSSEGEFCCNESKRHSIFLAIFILLSLNKNNLLLLKSTNVFESC